MCVMKFTDQYDAKLEIWARECRVHPLPGVPDLPRFRSMKFRSHAEMNAWKQELLERLAADGGVRWKK